MPVIQSLGRQFRPLWLLALVLALPGCGGSDPEVALEELEVVPLAEQLSELDLGSFVIPVPLTEHDSLEPVRENHLEMKFGLHALVTPKQLQDSEDLRELRAGELRDRVIRVCRNTALHELQDPDFSTFKLRLLDAIQPLFEGSMLDGLLLTNVQIESL